MEKQPFEYIGLIPRSIIRTGERFYQQLFSDSEKKVIQEFRVSRYQVIVSFQTFFTLCFFPFFLNFFLKKNFLKPFLEYLFNTNQKELFLNSFQKNQAFFEIRNFEEKLFFDFLLEEKINFFFDSSDFFQIFYATDNSFLEYFLQEKILEIYFQYNQKSVNALTNLGGDLITFLFILFLFSLLKPQILVMKSFFLESFYSFSDTIKSFVIIFFTDLLVGFHSPRGWEVLLHSILNYFGFPKNDIFILFFISTFPVFLDTFFKYWVFRHLNKISPSTVATYHTMIE